jgi:ADP-heptose:LPS heptosyltransferase
MSFSLKRFLRKSYAFRSIYWLGVLNWFDLAVKLGPVPQTPGQKKRIAFVKMDGIGDYVIWSAVFRDLDRIYPSETFERILIGNDRFQELAEGETTFDERLFVNLDRFAISPLYRFRTMKQIRSLGADIIVNARSARDLLWSDSMVRCSAAFEKIGSEGAGNLMGPIQARLTRRWYTNLRPAPVVGEHELQSNLNFLGLKGNTLSFPDRTESRTGVLAAGPPYAVYFLGSQINEKRWPVRNFALAADIISKRHGLETVICGGPEDKPLADAFSKASSLDVIDLTGNSLVELSALLEYATLVVSNDTGAAHIAALKLTPTVVIAAGNQVGRYFPYPNSIGVHVRAIQYPEVCKGCEERCVFLRWSESAVRPCVEKVSVEDVSDAADELLGLRTNVK